MTPSTIDHPPAPPETDRGPSRPQETRPSGDIEPATSRSPREPRARRERRLLAIGIVASAVFHAFVLLIFRFGIPLSPPAGPSASGADADPSAVGMQAVNLRVVEGDAADLPAAVEFSQDADVPQPVDPPAEEEADDVVLEDGATADGEQATGEQADDAMDASAVDRLRSGGRDPRLWERPEFVVAPPEEPGVAEKARQNLAARLDAVNDSVLASEEAARRANDWTYTDDSGRRWGISSEGIHLGGLTLPGPRFDVPAGRRDEIVERTREWEAIRGQVDRASRNDHFDERVRAIRERVDREREEAGTDDDGDGG